MRFVGHTLRPRVLGLALLAGTLGVTGTARATDNGPAADHGLTTVVFSKPAGTLSLTPGARTRPARPILGEPYVTSGFIRKELPTAATGIPYVSEGVLKVETDARGTPVAPPAPPKPAKSESPLQKRIVQACGRTAKNVEVVNDGPTGLRVRFQVRSLADAEKVTKQILKISDIVKYQVAFEVRVAP